MASPTPSPLYAKLLSLSQSYAAFGSMDSFFALRSPDALHSWGHSYLVSRNPGIQGRISNDAFRAQLLSVFPYLGQSNRESKIHDIIVDEHKRKSIIQMSYFFLAKGSEEVIENEMIWVLTFTKDEDVEKVLVKESVEFVDPAASARLGMLMRTLNLDGKPFPESVKGGTTIDLTEGY